VKFIVYKERVTRLRVTRITKYNEQKIKLCLVNLLLLLWSACSSVSCVEEAWQMGWSLSWLGNW